MMGKSSKNCKVPSHQILKDQAKNRVENLQLMLNQLQSARKERGACDVAKLEEQVNCVLREWKAELDAPSPASSLLAESLDSLGCLWEHLDVADDATSPLLAPPTMTNGHEHGHDGHGHITHGLAMADTMGDQKVYYANPTSQEHEFQGFQDHLTNHVPEHHEFQGFHNHTSQHRDFHGFEHCTGTPTSQGDMFRNFEASGPNNVVADNLNMNTQLDYAHLDLPQNFDNEIFLSPSGMEQWGFDDISDFSGLVSTVNPPPSAFLGPICALWDCARPAQKSELCSNYCSSFHAELASKECVPGTTTVLRPGGIGLKDGPLMSALKSKIEGKDVGIPECPGAASAKSPWNAPELFDVCFIDGEKIREWLFFDKPRRAFETGTRKQRSLPDHAGRGWHESRKMDMNDYGGRKRSYYADPQPQKNFEWHLYEYKIDACDAYALYRLELKVAEEKKKSPKPKVGNDPLADLQKRMGRLTAVVSTDDKRTGKGKAKGNVQSDTGDVLASGSSSEANTPGPGGLPEAETQSSTDNRKDC